MLDAGAGQVSLAIAGAGDIVQGFIKGVVGPFFVQTNCTSTLDAMLGLVIMQVVIARMLHQVLSKFPENP